MDNRIEYKFIKENEKLVLIEHDNYWKRDIARAVGSKDIIKWLKESINQCKQVISVTDNKKANKAIENLKNTYEELLLQVR